VLDLVTVALVVAALRRAAEVSLGGRVVNVGSGVGTPLRDLANRIARLPSREVGLRVLPARAIEVTCFIADVARMRDLLDLAPPADPLEGLATLWTEEDHQ